jgi:uncharacterized OB-fold protein
MGNYEKPVPVPDAVTGPFWEAAKQGRLLIQHCPQCGARQFYPQSSCRRCLSEALEWVESKGRGTIYSHSTVYRAPSRPFEPDVPYIVALVDLDEGCRLVTNIVDVSPRDVRVGMPVEVVFDRITPEISLPKFRPRGKP